MGTQARNVRPTDRTAAMAGLGEDTAEFVRDHDLHDGLLWLLDAIPRFFPGADFQLEVPPPEEEEHAVLALWIESALAPRDFREKRHELCEAMLDAGHRELHRLIGVSQRRI